MSGVSLSGTKNKFTAGHSCLAFDLDANLSSSVPPTLFLLKLHWVDFMKIMGAALSHANFRNNAGRNLTPVSESDP
jgi:hypothetical protein